jgi:uncharacterized protein YijF (DUF1287 family)
MKVLYTLICSLLLIATSSFAETSTNKTAELIKAALDQTRERVIYNPAYFKISYPNGDVPSHYGVCTDVVIRAYRKLGIDLQEQVHQDIKNNFSIYPAKRQWNQNKPDTNIDHRRVPNLQTFFTRKGKKLSVTDNPADYQPGDLVTWMLGNKLPHIGIVVDKKSADGERYLIVHNVGAGPQLEDVLFAYPVSGHYRYALD